MFEGENMKKLKRAVGIILVIIVIIVSILCVNAFIANPLSNELDFWGVRPKNNVEFISESVDIKDKEYFVYSALSDGSENNNIDQYVIAVGKISGINNNKYDLFSYSEQDDNALLSPKYLNIYDYPEAEIKTGSNYYGSVYVGTVPDSCQSVTINGLAATMVHQTFELNGKPANFYLYYCIVEQNEYPHNTEVIVTDENGSSYSVSTVDGGEYPIVNRIN